MALTDTPDEVEWATKNNPGATNYVGVNLYVPSTSKALADWCGFYNNRELKAYAEKTANITLQDFPAAYACETYGDGYGLSAPGNTTGWFLPSVGMNEFLLKQPDEIIETTGLEYEKQKLLKERLETIIEYIKYDLSYNVDYAYVGAIDVCSSQSSYWSSNESIYKNYALVSSTSKALDQQIKTTAGTSKIRPFLVF